MADANEVEYGNAASKVRFEEEIGKLKNRQGETVLAVTDDQNVGIGTTTPASKLDVEGSVAIGATYSGTTAAPANGLTVEGKMGVGTPTPTETLHVRDGRTSGGSAGVLVQKFEAVSGTSYGAFIEATGGSTKNIGLYVQAEGGSTNYGLLVPNGDVGIGTTGPDRKLDILHASDPQLRLTQADGSVFTDLEQGAAASDGLIISTTGQNCVLKSDTARIDLTLQNSSAVGTAGSNNGLRITQNGDTATFMNHGDDQSGGNMIFSIAGSAAMTLSKVNGDRNMVTTGEMTMGDDPATDAHIVNGTIALNNTATLAEAKSLSLAAPLLPTTNSTATGVTAEMLAGQAITAFNLVCISAAEAGQVLHTDANAAATMPAIGIAVEGIDDAATGTILLQGFVRNDTWAWNLGAVLYASGAIGGMTETAPAVTGDIVQAVGIALNADVVYFNPSLTLVTVA